MKEPHQRRAEREGLPVREERRWRYVLTAPVAYDAVAGRVVVPEGFRFYIGAQGIAIPPFTRGLLRAALLHDFLYDHWLDRPAGLAHADTAMVAEMRLHETPRLIRHLVWIIIRTYGAFRNDSPVLPPSRKDTPDA